MSKSFFDSFECRSGHHCRVCRDERQGRDFRRAVARFFHLECEDFACPHLDDQGQPSPAPTLPRYTAPMPTGSTIPDWLRRRIAICEGDDDHEECDHWRGQPIMRCAKQCNCSPCYRAKLNHHCPLSLW